MCGAPKIPKSKPPVAEPTPVSEAVIDEAKDRRRNTRLRAGVAGTLLTGAGGLDEPDPKKKTLLGG